MAQRTAVTSTRALYKYLLRETEKLPSNAKIFYRNSIKREYDQHKEESDPERIQQIIEQSIKDADWIVNKYTKTSNK